MMTAKIIASELQDDDQQNKYDKRVTNTFPSVGVPGGDPRWVPL